MSNEKDMSGQFCWNELMVPDVEKAKSFYTSLFGWEAQTHDMGSGNYYTMFKHNNKDIGGMMQTPKGQENHIPSHWTSYVAVKVLEPMVEKAQKLGAKIIVPITPVGDFGRFAMIEDPTGAKIALWQMLQKKQ